MNAWAAFHRALGDTPRYTFTALEKLPDQMYVAHGEPFSLGLRLTQKTEWRPQEGVAQLGAAAGQGQAGGGPL